MAVSGLETIRKLLGVGELLYFETELLICVMNGLHCRPVKGIKSRTLRCAAVTKRSRPRS